ncbi:MAG: hypothetical protein J6R74_02365 [Tidjanibacter sp.]|nr:hypothetical protein [Tidjanibacter sp.]
MSMVFKFRMLSDESDVFVRDYEVKYDMNLLEFNDFICRDLRYDNSGMTSFFLSDGQWMKLREFTLMDMGAGMGGYADEPDEAPLPLEKIVLGQLIHNNHDRLIWLFDMFADRAYYLEMIEAKFAEEGVEYPRTLFAHGEPSDQYDPEAGGANEKSIFEEMMDDFGDFGGGDDSYDDEY